MAERLEFRSYPGVSDSIILVAHGRAISTRPATKKSVADFLAPGEPDGWPPRRDPADAEPADDYGELLAWRDGSGPLQLGNDCSLERWIDTIELIRWEAEALAEYRRRYPDPRVPLLELRENETGPTLLLTQHGRALSAWPVTDRELRDLLDPGDLDHWSLHVASTAGAPVDDYGRLVCWRTGREPEIVCTDNRARTRLCELLEPIVDAGAATIPQISVLGG